MLPAEYNYQQKLIKDRARMAKEQREESAWNKILPTIKEQDFDVLRDFLVDMCSATLPESSPSQKEWDEIRARAKEAAVAHAMHNRDEKKAWWRGTEKAN